MKSITFKDKYNNGYLYSFQKKKLLPLEPLLYDWVDIYLSSDEANEIESISKIEKTYKTNILLKKKFDFLKTNHFLDEKKVSVTGTISSKDIEQNIDNLPVLIFEVTEKCNLKCEYCIYGDMYIAHPDKTEIDMSFEKAKAIIDYFVDFSNNRPAIQDKKQSISFYGGEPLLRFDLIKQIIEYTQSIQSLSYSYSITTNGLLLNKYYKQLVEWNVKLLVSLDGDQSSSQYRRTSGGKESFSVIYENMIEIKSEHPKYFEEMVDFNAVMHDKNPLNTLLPFMKTHFNKIPQCASLVSVFLNDDAKDNFDKISNNDYLSACDKCGEFSLEAIYKINPHLASVISFTNNYSGYTFKNFRSILYSGMEEQYVPSGTCIPFSTRLLVSADGNLYPCERIGYSYSIGHINAENEVEIDLDKLVNDYNSMYDKIRSKCAICYNIYNCTTCLFQRDMDCTPIGKSEFAKKIENTINGIHSYGKKFRK